MSPEEKQTRLRADLVSAVVAILRYSADENQSDRHDVLELLRLSNVAEIEPALRVLAVDEDELVRATAIEIASDLRLGGVDDIYVSALNDKSSLVRQCSAVAIGESMSAGCLEALEQAIVRESDPEVRQKIYYAFWRLGHPQYAFSFLEGLFHSHYRIRCFTVNLLGDFVTPANRGFLVSLVRTLLKNEDTIAARSSIEDFLQVFDVSE